MFRLFSKLVVTAGGTPKLTLETGTELDVVMRLVAKAIRLFAHQNKGDVGSDLDYASTSALALSGDAIGRPVIPQQLL